MKKKPPYTVEEHKKLAADLRRAQEILEPYLEDFCDIFGRKSREFSLIYKCLVIISNKLCVELDKRFCETRMFGDDSICSEYFQYDKKSYI